MTFGRGDALGAAPGQAGLHGCTDDDSRPETAVTFAALQGLVAHATRQDGCLQGLAWLNACECMQV